MYRGYDASKEDEAIIPEKTISVKEKRKKQTETDGLELEIKTKEHTNYLNSLAEHISEFFISRGIILRPLGNIVYILPPYCISNDDLEYIYNAVEEFLNLEV